MGKLKELFQQKPISLQIAEVNETLMELEQKLVVLIKMERNAVKTASSRYVKQDAEDRLLSAYVSLRLVQIAQERMFAVSNAQMLKNTIVDLNKTLATINRIGNKTDGLSPAIFLNFRSKKLLNHKREVEDGGMINYYDESIEKILVSKETKDKLLNTNESIQKITKDDEETMRNLDDVEDFVRSSDNPVRDTGSSSTNLQDELEKLVDNVDL